MDAAATTMAPWPDPGSPPSVRFAFLLVLLASSQWVSALEELAELTREATHDRASFFVAVKALCATLQ